MNDILCVPAANCLNILIFSSLTSYLMKHLFLLALLFLLTVAANCQKALQNQVSPKEYKPYGIKIKSSAFKNESPYYFKVTDKRDDSTRLGFMKDGDQQIYFHFNEPASGYLFPKLNNAGVVYKDTIIIVLHKLWVFESFLPRKQKLVQWNTRDYKIKCFGRVAADIYKSNNGRAVQLLSYDSSISTNGYMANNVDYLLAKNLNILLHMADSTAKAITTDSKPNDAFPATDAAIPAGPFKDGIFLTFQDFLKNEPVDIPFTYEVKKKFENIILTDARRDDSLYTQYNWGFCKNGDVYMRIGPSFSRLTRIENSFELRAVDLARFYVYNGFRQADMLGLAVDVALVGYDPTFLLTSLAGLLLPKDKYFARYENISAFKLDLKTGEVY